MASYHFVRLLRTSSSERYVVQRQEQDIGACDLHFPSERRVVGSLFLLATANVAESEIEAIVQQIDEQLLPDIHREDSDFMFTVLRGEVIGAYSPNKTND